MNRLLSQLECSWTGDYAKIFLLLTAIACLVVAIVLKFRKTAAMMSMTINQFHRENILLKAVLPSCPEEDASQSTVRYLSWLTSWQGRSKTSPYTMKQTCPSWTLRMLSLHWLEIILSAEMWTTTAKQMTSSDATRRKCWRQRSTRPSLNSFKTSAMAPFNQTSRIST